jgi:hypothetical protein
MNQRDGTLRNVSKLGGNALQVKRVNRGMAMGDLFYDGRMEKGVVSSKLAEHRVKLP